MPNNRTQMRSRNAMLQHSAQTTNNVAGPGGEKQMAQTKTVMNPSTGLDMRPGSAKRMLVEKPQHMMEQTPNKTINQSQGSNMHPISYEPHKKRSSNPPFANDPSKT